MRVNVTTRKRKRCTAVMLDYHDASGRRHQRVYGKASTADELKAVMECAEVEAKRIEVELADGVHKPKMGDEPIDAILVEFAEHAGRSNYRDKTRAAYEDAIRVFRRFINKDTRARRAKDLTPALIVAFVQHEKARGMSGDTICSRLTRLRRIFRRCINRGVMDSDPTAHPDVADVKPQPRHHQRIFSHMELDAFLAGVRSLSGSALAADLADYFRLLSETGLRLSEALHLRWCDIHFGGEHGGYLDVRPHDNWRPKTKSSERPVPLTPRIEDMLRRRLGACETLDPYASLWPARFNDILVHKVFRRVCRRLGIDGLDDQGQRLRVHSLRHYYATRLVTSGADPATTRDILGHASIVVSNRYFNVPRATLFDAARLAFSGDTRVVAPGEQPPIPLAVNASQKTSQTPAVLSGFQRKSAPTSDNPASPKPL